MNKELYTAELKHIIKELASEPGIKIDLFNIRESSDGKHFYLDFWRNAEKLREIAVSSALLADCANTKEGKKKLKNFLRERIGEIIS